VDAREKTLTQIAASLSEDSEKAAQSAEIAQIAVKALEEMAAVERAVYSSETEEYARWKEERKRWMTKWATISREIKPLISRMKAVVSSLDANDAAFLQAPPEVRERLLNRKEGLEIISRMLGRLPQRLEQMAVNEPPDDGALESLRLFFNRYEARLNSLAEPRDVRSEIERLLEEIEPEEGRVRDVNYDLIRETRLSADRLKRAVTGFLKDHLLPASDGLEQGIRDEDRLLEPMIPHETEYDLVERWFGAYHHCHRLLRGFMKRVGLTKLEALYGTEFNPEWHTALGTGTDSGLSDGQIQELLMSGWRLYGFVIRPAAVLVVKN
jgi:molecular chaperone GrpE (heat shock protein)